MSTLWLFRADVLKALKDGNDMGYSHSNSTIMFVGDEPTHPEDWIDTSLDINEIRIGR